jgi:hypothetical protein
MTDEELVAAVNAAAARDQKAYKSMAPPGSTPRHDNYVTAERRHLELLAAIKTAADRICDHVGTVEDSVRDIYQGDRG